MLKGLKAGSPKIINSHYIKNVLKKGHSIILPQLHSIQAFEDASHLVHLDFWLVLDKKQQVFDHPQGLPPSHGQHDHSISL
jgi:hypothetical protein